MSQGEILRLADFGLTEAQVGACRNGAIAELIDSATIRSIARAGRPNRSFRPGRDDRDPGLDETFEAIRAEMRRFADAEVIPHAQGWHRANAYIPMK